MILRLLTASEAEVVLALQDAVVESLPDEELYVSTGRDALLLAMERDYVFGIWEENTLIAAAICIKNRPCDGNLGQSRGENAEEAFTFDAVFVHPAHRGRGLQRMLIAEAAKYAKSGGAKAMWCTVSPKNPYSYRNLTKEGFLPVEKDAILYGGRRRDVLKLELNK